MIGAFFIETQSTVGTVASVEEESPAIAAARDEAKKALWASMVSEQLSFGFQESEDEDEDEDEEGNGVEGDDNEVDVEPEPDDDMSRSV